MTGPLQAGDIVLLVDRKQRRFLVDLAAGKEFHSHAGVLAHDDLIGQPDGSTVKTSLGQALIAIRPTLADYVLKMKRAATVVYPKDLGAILMLADVAPGMHVVEAGIGSGALAITLLRAVGPAGRVTSYEVREDHAAQALRNIGRYCGEVPNHTLRMGDVAELEETGVDRVVLDVPEPWRVAEAAAAALAPGGIILTYVPTVPQVQQSVDALRGAGFGFVQTLEVLHRTWNIDGPSVRPDHRMVAHTGFLTVGRLLVGGP